MGKNTSASRPLITSGFDLRLPYINLLNYSVSFHIKFQIFLISTPMVVAEFVIVAVLLAGGAYAVSVLTALFSDCKVEDDSKFLQMEEVKASVIGKQAN